MDLMNILIRLCRICWSNLYQKEKWSLYLDTCAFAYNTSLIIPQVYTFLPDVWSTAYLPVDADLQIQSPEELCTGYYELKDPGVSSK